MIIVLRLIQSGRNRSHAHWLGRSDRASRPPHPNQRSYLRGNQVIDPHMTRLLSVGGGTDVKRRASLKNVNQYQIRTIGTPMS
jgi:hypothetical protein